MIWSNGKIVSCKPVFLLTDPVNPNKLLSTSKVEYDKLIKEAVTNKLKFGDSSAKASMELLEEKKESGPSREPTNTGTVPNVSGTNQIMIKSDWVRDIPVFRSSENDILDEWFYVVEKLATKNKVSYDALVEEVTPYLKNRALGCYRIWEKESYDKSWESLKGKFNSLYNSRDSQNKLREKLLSMKTHKQNFEESVKKFESVVGKVMNITEVNKIFLFSHTLVENGRQFVTVMKPNSLREAIELA
ncbi:unnamed protein product [Brachionus calyciflorus]|uniref:Retrotransposon gag domain-containing protein n=1 Tax=Brachionus calyciflorus TaxID=104777 RepID=A0A813SHF5_9BILA|nr:unnamed protein product [Brachionus calyciflorus]